MRACVSYPSFDVLCIRKKSVTGDDIEGCVHRGHCDHAAAECRPKVIFLDRLSDLSRDEACTDRNAAAKGFCKRGNVRHDPAGGLAPGKEPLACSANSCLHFVEDKRRADLITPC